MVEEKVREEARKIARILGDQEWEMGNTKYAFEAWEVSDITTEELLSYAKKLLKAEEMITEALRAVPDLRGRSYSGNEKDLLSYQVTEKAGKCYLKKIQEILGWKQDLNIHFSDQQKFFRSAALGCLKMINRMS